SNTAVCAAGGPRGLLNVPSESTGWHRTRRHHSHNSQARHEQELALQVVLGNTLMAAKGYAALETEQTYARAHALCQQLGDTPHLPPRWRFRLTRGWRCGPPGACPCTVGRWSSAARLRRALRRYAAAWMQPSPSG